LSSGVGLPAFSVRGGNSSSGALFDERGVELEPVDGRGGRDALRKETVDFFFLLENQPFLLGISSSSFTTIRSSWKSGS
jgi:hypothetical protein